MYVHFSAQSTFSMYPQTKTTCQCNWAIKDRMVNKKTLSNRHAHKLT